jgi:hypothetical protein
MSFRFGRQHIHISQFESHQVQRAGRPPTPFRFPFAIVMVFCVAAGSAEWYSKATLADETQGMAGSSIPDMRSSKLSPKSHNVDSPDT